MTAVAVPGIHPPGPIEKTRYVAHSTYADAFGEREVNF
jgi:hypothetical protein